MRSFESQIKSVPSNMTTRTNPPQRSSDGTGTNAKASRGGSNSPLRGVVDISKANSLKQRTISNVIQSFSASLSMSDKESSGKSKSDTIPSATLYLDTSSLDDLDASDNNRSPLWNGKAHSENYSSPLSSFKESSSKSKTDTIPEATSVNDNRSPVWQENSAKGQIKNLKSFFGKLSPKASVKISSELEPMPFPTMGSPNLQSPKRRGSNSLIQHMQSAQGSIIQRLNSLRDSQKNDEYELVGKDSPYHSPNKLDKVHHAIEEQDEIPSENCLEDSSEGDRDDDNDDDRIRLGELTKTYTPNTWSYKISLIMHSHPWKTLATLIFIITCIVITTVYVDAIVEDRACFFLSPPFNRYKITSTDESACNHILPLSTYYSPLNTTVINLYPNTVYNVVLFGDSMVDYACLSHNLTGKIVDFLPQYATNLRFFNKGIPDTSIAEQKDRLQSTITSIYQEVSRIDAWLMFWDTDTSNTVWCGTTADQRNDIQSQYETDLTDVIQTIQTQIPNAFLSIGGPWTQGEGMNHCNNLPEYDYKIGIYNHYRNINQELCDRMHVLYMDFRSAYLQLLPTTWNDYAGCMTGDGEHQNERGTIVIAKIFAEKLLMWLSTVNY